MKRDALFERRLFNVGEAALPTLLDGFDDAIPSLVPPLFRDRALLRRLIPGMSLPPDAHKHRIRMSALLDLLDEPFRIIVQRIRIAARHEHMGRESARGRIDWRDAGIFAILVREQVGPVEVLCQPCGQDDTPVVLGAWWDLVLARNGKVRGWVDGRDGADEGRTERVRNDERETTTGAESADGHSADIVKFGMSVDVMQDCVAQSQSRKVAKGGSAMRTCA